MEDNQEGKVLDKIRHGSTEWRERAPMASARQTPTRQPHSYQIFHHCIAMLHNSVLPRDGPLLQNNHAQPRPVVVTSLWLIKRVH